MRALLLVDLQNDFMPGGALGAPRGDEVVAVANRLMGRFEIVVASQDWHPPDHGSFASQHHGKNPGDVIELEGLRQELWPDHCVQGSPGASFHSALEVARINHVIRKGADRNLDSYSAFFDNAHRRDTGLAGYLTDKGVEDLYLMGLATDYCVKFTVVDARRLDFKVTLVEDGCRGIDVNPGDVERAWQGMREAGARVISSDSA